MSSITYFSYDLIIGEASHKCSNFLLITHKRLNHILGYNEKIKHKLPF